MRVPFIDLSAMTREVGAQVSAGWSALLDSNRFVGGEAVDRFESQWATYCGAGCAVGVANGTDALQLALRAMGVGPGDEVIVPANSFVATAEAVVLAGATPRFADVDPETLLMSAATVAPLITPRTAVVIVVHLYGQMPDMDLLGALAARYGIALIEDAAQAHGARWQDRTAGSIGAVGCFSFYPGKNLGAFGEAGAVVTSDAALAARVRSMRDHGRIAGSHYDHGEVGTNSRLDALQAIVLSAKLERLDEWNAARRRIADRYRCAMMAGPVHPVAEGAGARSVYHLAVARAPRRAEVRHWLESWGIETGIHYPTPIHQMQPYRLYADGPLPAVEAAAPELLSLPMFPHMSEEQLGRVCQALELVDELLRAREAVRA
jgi:dTDP-4-amino-4,6-dideoxygalactose transaminase